MMVDAEELAGKKAEDFMYRVRPQICMLCTSLERLLYVLYIYLRTVYA